MKKLYFTSKGFIKLINSFFVKDRVKQESNYPHMKTLISVILTILSFSVNAQDDLMSLLEDSSKTDAGYTTATFKSTRIMNGHSTERMTEGILDVRISHRFGTLNSGGYEFFGLDQSNIHLGLEYGILDWLMAGIGRGSFEKTYDAFAKFSILRQSSGTRVMPVSISLLTSAAYKSIKISDISVPDDFSSRLSYTGQLLVSRKMNQWLSFQISPTLIHYNYVLDQSDPSNLMAIGAGGRVRLSKRASLNAEYYLLADDNPQIFGPVYNPLSVGFDIETGGHVFQLIFTNSVAMIEKSFIGETTGKWADGDIHFGFNISRVFKLKDRGIPKSNY